MKRINIVAWHNGGGLSRDIEILFSALQGSDFDLHVNGFPLAQAPVRRQRIVHRISNLAYAWRHRRQLTSAPYDVNIFLEDISPAFFRYARVNAFIPNPEWFKRYQRLYLRGIDVVLCKTRGAQATFDALGSRTRLISFTSEDRRDTAGRHAQQPGFLHVAGRSWQKGTGALIDAWLKHPEWPLLTIVQNAKTYAQRRVKPIDAPNIRHLLQRLDDGELQALQNTYTLHLCPSEAEGFGHCIAEAMSCGALTLTTDAPPMNELITPERGILVRYHRMRKQRAGANYYVDPLDLEHKIGIMLRMDAASRQGLGQQARAWYEENDRAFRARLVDALGEASAGRASRQT
jgi:glycosyltransferase involved in cell wall biosynthesis